MKEVLEGNLELSEANVHVDRCLGCLACVTACPSGVQYGELLAPFRALNQTPKLELKNLTKILISSTLPYPKRFRLAASLGRFGKPFKSVLPKPLKAMLELLPEVLPNHFEMPEFVPAIGQRRARVALLTGCAQQVLAPEINRATLEVLSKNGVEVVIPKTQGCCGAILMHTGQQTEARALARKNLEVFPNDLDAIITNAAGCGSGIHEYGLLFAGEAEESRASALSARVKDISVFLAELGLVTPLKLENPLTVAYHDACHLAHAQGVRIQPRSLLASIENLKLLELSDPEICCGSAGTYNIEQPEIASELGRRKAKAVIESGANLIASGNIGCLTQLKTHLERLGHNLPVLHTIEILRAAMP
jgi:glycolate oxidase iron-sulfur subunit